MYNLQSIRTRTVELQLNREWPFRHLSYRIAYRTVCVHFHFTWALVFLSNLWEKKGSKINGLFVKINNTNNFPLSFIDSGRCRLGVDCLVGRFFEPLITLITIYQFIYDLFFTQHPNSSYGHSDKQNKTHIRQRRSVATPPPQSLGSVKFQTHNWLPLNILLV